MKKNIYLVYKLPIWVCVFTAITLITLISCHNATANPPSIELIRNNLKNNLDCSFNLNDVFLGKISKGDNSITLNIEEPKNISQLNFILDDTGLNCSFDDLTIDVSNLDLIKDNKLYLISEALNSVYLDNEAQVSRWNDVVKIKTSYKGKEYKIYLDKNFNITNIKSENLDFSVI